MASIVIALNEDSSACSIKALNMDEHRYDHYLVIQNHRGDKLLLSLIVPSLAVASELQRAVNKLVRNCQATAEQSTALALASEE